MHAGSSPKNPGKVKPPFGTDLKDARSARKEAASLMQAGHQEQFEVHPFCVEVVTHLVSPTCQCCAPWHLSLPEEATSEQPDLYELRGLEGSINQISKVSKPGHSLDPCIMYSPRHFISVSTRARCCNGRPPL